VLAFYYIDIVLVLFVMIGFGINGFLDEGDSLIDPNEVLCVRPEEAGIFLGSDIFLSSEEVYNNE
jgi:hypothetical protein